MVLPCGSLARSRRRLNGTAAKGDDGAITGEASWGEGGGMN